jgi:CHASE3 domain sensor protein
MNDLSDYDIQLDSLAARLAEAEQISIEEDRLHSLQQIESEIRAVHQNIQELHAAVVGDPENVAKRQLRR